MKFFDKLFNRAYEAQELPELQEPQEEEQSPSLFKLYRGEKQQSVVGCPRGATIDQIERMTLIQVGPKTSEQDCIDLIRAITESLPPHEAKNIIVTRETDISVFQWKKEENKHEEV